MSSATHLHEWLDNTASIEDLHGPSCLPFHLKGLDGPTDPRRTSWELPVSKSALLRAAFPLLPASPNVTHTYVGVNTWAARRHSLNTSYGPVKILIITVKSQHNNRGSGGLFFSLRLKTQQGNLDLLNFSICNEYVPYLQIKRSWANHIGWMVGEARNREGQASPLPADVAVFPAHTAPLKPSTQVLSNVMTQRQEVSDLQKTVKIKMLFNKNKQHKNTTRVFF